MDVTGIKQQLEADGANAEDIQPSDWMDLREHVSRAADLTAAQTISGAWTFSTVPTVPDDAYGAGWNGSLAVPTKNAIYDKIETLGGGGGTPGGSDTQIQFNDGGAFGGDAGLVYNKTTDAVTLAGALTIGGHLLFSGATNIGDGAGSSPVYIYAEGAVRSADGSVSAAGIGFASDVRDGLYHPGTATMAIGLGGVTAYFLGQVELRARSDGTIGFSSSTDPSATGIDTRLTRQAAGRLAVMGTTATPAGGSTGLALVFGSTSGFGIYIGSGAPTVSAAQGSLYLRSDGSGTTNRAYINNSAGSGTTWTALTTAA